MTQSLIKHELMNTTTAACAVTA